MRFLHLHLFEFGDQTWLPQSLRQTMREALERAMSPPFRRYYEWVAETALECAKLQRISTIVELGAGPAKITRKIAEALRSDSIHFIVTDLAPDITAYAKLEEDYPGRITAIYTPFDFRDTPVWPPDSLIVISGSLHHIPHEHRIALLEQWSRSARHILIFEPLRRNAASIVFAAFSFIPALLMPLIDFAKPGRLRRILWSWIIPAAPLMFSWDGIMSCIRQWTHRDWSLALQRLPSRGERPAIATTTLCQTVSLVGFAAEIVAPRKDEVPAASPNTSTCI